MGFQPGRKKTGGRTKNAVSAAKRSSKFVERLKAHGFNFDSQFADALKDIKSLRTLISGDPKKLPEERARAEELRFFYSELKSLLPFMTPKLREKEVELGDEPEAAAEPETPVTDEELLKAMDDGKPAENLSRGSAPEVVEARDSQLQVPASPGEDLPYVAGEQEDDE